jgi:glycosyltransferase involved in cell wall biosynthesis
MLAQTMSKPSAEAPAYRYKISVIIPCLNEERVIGRCLEALVAQDFPKDAFEVIVVDNGSTDGTLEIVRSYLPALHLTILSNAGAKIAGLRNLGAASATGEALAFLDSDCVPPATWLSRASALLSIEGCGVIGAHYSIPAKSSWVARVWYRDNVRNNTGRVSYVPAGDLLVSHPTFSRLGGFDEVLETNEDYEFCRRANHTGLAVMAFPEIAVIHLGTPQTVRGFYRQHRWHGKHVLKVFLRNIRAFPNAKAILFAFYVFLCLIGLVLGIGRIVASGQFDLLIASLSALLLAPLSIGIWKAFRLDKWGDLLPMTFLYLVYGIARAFCLIDLGKESARKRVSDA